jgi:hypothetical protein
VNLGHLLFTINDYTSARDAFQKASRMYVQLGISNKSEQMKAYSFWMEARIYWDNKNWEASEDCYVNASTLFLKCSNDRLSAILEVMSKLLFISKYYRDAIDSETLVEAKEKISDITSRFSKILDGLKDIRFPDFELVKVQFECIEILNNALNYRSIKMESFEKAREIFRKHNFTTPLYAVNALENFVIELSKYGRIEEISPKRERELLIILQPCDTLDGVISREVDRRGFEKSTKKIIDAIRISEQKIEAKVEGESKKVITEIRLSKEEILNALNKQAKLISEIKELNEKQPEQLRESIIEELSNDINKTQEKEKIDKWEKEKKVISYGLDIIDFVVNVIQIYSTIQGGQPEVAMNQGFSSISRYIERIKRG